MKDKKILVIGGNGKTGRKVAEGLMRHGKSIRIGSRNENPAFDWEKPETWENALDRIKSVYITYQPDLAVPGARKSIEEFTSLAVKNRLKKMVLLSGKGEKEAELCEEVVKNTGADWTIVRASWFNQNFSESFFLDPIKAGYVALPKAETLIPFVDTNDIAEVAVEALVDEKHNGKTYELTGPRQLTFKKVIEEISDSTGRNINFDSITMDEYKRLLAVNNVPEDYIWLINYLFTEVLVEKNSVITHDIEKVLGRKAKDFSEYIKETAETGIWDSF